jgi:hypothetical protein
MARCMSSYYEFIHELINTKDPIRSSQVSRMLLFRGDALLDSIRSRQPAMANEWAVKITGKILAQEGEMLAEHLRPEQGRQVTDILDDFRWRGYSPMLNGLRLHFASYCERLGLQSHSIIE